LENSSARAKGAAKAGARLKRPRVATELTESLRQDIVTGRLLKGGRMPSERVLAERYGVSQPTVRESLRALEIIGLIDVRHGNGTFVSDGDNALVTAMLTMLQVSDVRLDQVNQVRDLLALEALKLAASTATAQQVQAIEKASEAIERIQSFEHTDDLMETHTAFFRTVSAASNNVILTALSNFLTTLLAEVHFAFLSERSGPARRNLVQSLHPLRREIIDALRRRDIAAAEAVGRRYMSCVHEATYSKVDIGRFRLSDPDLVKALGGLTHLTRS
jgi:GntR family transcriptional regulator, transcriptional repressor for pyruvate dehydrogenase complex